MFCASISPAYYLFQYRCVVMLSILCSEEWGNCLFFCLFSNPLDEFSPLFEFLPVSPFEFLVSGRVVGKWSDL